MRKQIAGVAWMALAGTLTIASPQQDRDDRKDHDDHHDNGKHNGRNHREGRDDGDHHDNGKHKGWYKHADRDDYRDWDDDHDRIRPGRRYPYGRYGSVKQSFVSVSVDYRARRVILYDRSNWVVAPYDIDRCRDWQWNRDSVFVYDDDHHPGWYLLFNARLGRYVHVEYSGMR
jgi:hypothetical protein